MTSSLQEGEIRTIIGEWNQVALTSADSWEIPIADVERRLRTLPRAEAWAIGSDARAFWLLSPDQMLYTVEITEDGNLLSTIEQSLTGDTVVVRRSEAQPTRYQDTENQREIEWTFGHENGAPFLTLVGTTWTNRQTGQQRRDRAQRLAEAIAQLAR